MSDDHYHEDETDGLGGMGHASFNNGDPALRFKAGVPDWVNKNYLLNRRSGWTRRAIAHFLGKPDVRRENRWGMFDNCVTHECLYRGARVLAVERSPKFLAWVVKRNTRQTRPRRRPEGVPAYGFRYGIPGQVKPTYRAFSRRDRQIIRLLLVKGLRQRTVAEQIQVSQQTVSRIKRVFIAKMLQHARSIPK